MSDFTIDVKAENVAVLDAVIKAYTEATLLNVVHTVQRLRNAGATVRPIRLIAASLVEMEQRGLLNIDAWEVEALKGIAQSDGVSFRRAIKELEEIPF